MDKKKNALGKRKKAGDDQIPTAVPAKKAKNAVGKAVQKKEYPKQQPPSATRKTAREQKKKEKEEQKKQNEKQKKAASKKRKDNDKKKKEKDDKKKLKDQDDKDVQKDKDDKQDQEEKEQKEESKMVYGLKKGGAVVDTNLKNSQKYRVCVDGSTIFDKNLMYSDVGNNNNKFYIIQLLEDDTKSGSSTINYLFTRWGRVGQKGSQSLISFDQLRGKAQFTKKLYAKKTKGYRQIQITYDDDDEDANDDGNDDNDQTKKISSKLSKQVESLMNLIFDVKVLDQTLKQIGYDAKKMPLGKLSEDTIKQGYDWLNKIAEELKKEKLSKKSLQQLSSEFYSCIPHDFGRQHMSKFTILTNEDLKRKIQTLDALKDMTVANKIIKKSKDQKRENPADSKFKELECGIKALDPESTQFKILKEYYQNTGQGFYQKSTLSEIFEIDRNGEQARFNSGKGKLDNHMLLWHGSRVSNFGGILRQGLRIAPPQAPSAGYNFGKGLYFADMATKSLCYCRGGGSGSQLLILLVEVAIGEPNIKLNFDFNAAKLPPGKDSTWGVGSEAPPEGSYVEIEPGLMVPKGKGERNAKGKYLSFNEFIVYDESQVRMRYLIRCKVN